MKINKYIYLCACLLLCGTVASAGSPGASDEDVQKNFNRLVKTRECPRCNLQGAILTRMDLQGVNLQGANLSGAKLSLTNLSKANLKNAILQGAVLGGADFAGADLRGADLTDAQLAGAYLNEARLDQEIPQEEPYEPEDVPEEIPEENSDIGEKRTLPDPSSQPSPQEGISPELQQDTPTAETEATGPLQKVEGEKKK
ncbi:MAG: pentapeptide repeat-containing protein, partial [Candidatus Electrothrix sp. ATG2]|nr:pentapeptide repeat-containing protein [Candidatus Electrothrix sp. ATG2]